MTARERRGSPGAWIRKFRLAHVLVRIVVQLLETGLSVLLLLARVRFLLLTAPGRIGHLCTDPAMFVKRQQLGLDRKYVGVLISPPGVAPNECLLDHWRRYIVVVRSPRWARMLTRLTRFKYLEYDARTPGINETAPHIEVDRKWGNRAPLFEISASQRRDGEAALLELGVPAGAEYVCFHCREPGYSASDDDSQSYRDSNIENYAAALEALTRRGIWCIRMGDPSTRPLASRARMIDYAHSPLRSEQLDVFLPASCKFFLGGSSGLIYVAGVFGRPTGSANHAPVSSVLAFGPNDVAIPKLLWSEGESRYLTFAEALRSDIGNFRYTNLYRERGIRTVENTAADIGELVREMLERSEGAALYTAGDEERQRRFTALIRPGHYSYGGINRVGRDFLRKYEHLIE